MKQQMMTRFKKYLPVDRPDAQACWPWQGTTMANGYGQFIYHGKHYYAHRVSYELFHGEAPGKGFVCHTCDNKLCVNPAHLYLGTPATNLADALERGRFPIGEDAGQAKLSEEQVKDVFTLWNNGKTQEEIADLYGVSGTTIHAIIAGRNWKHVPRPRLRQPPRVHVWGSKHPNSKLTDDKVREIRRLHAAGGYTFAALARRYGVSLSLVSKIVKRKTWRHVE